MRLRDPKGEGCTFPTLGREMGRPCTFTETEAPRLPGKHAPDCEPADRTATCSRSGRECCPCDPCAPCTGRG